MTFGWQKDGFALSLAQNDADLHAVQNLRYRVFVQELGGDGVLVDHENQREKDRFDACCDHLMLRDVKTGSVVAAYRLLQHDHARTAGQFYTETEFDISALENSGRTLLELGRSCVDPNYRNGPALFHLWSGLAEYAQQCGAELFFGTASLPGTDLDSLGDMLSLLHHQYLAPQTRRTVARGPAIQPRALDSIDRKSVMVSLPPLLKAYLRMGARVGQGAYVDHAFGCTDVCIVMDADALNEKFARRYRREAAE